ncbi:MAG: ribonuclease HI [Gammaproteobacteria bacterium]|nr:ribonuclease HI [Gammaproteobacteria bacterium]
MTGKVILFTDGACRGNPGPGGWGAYFEYDDARKELYGFASDTTNNRMEMMAVIEGLKALKRPCEIHLNTDSKYVLQGITEWMKGWKKNGWKTAAKKPVKNADLWQQLDNEVSRHQIIWKWVKGHSGIHGNEMADQLANKAIDEQTS